MKLPQTSLIRFFKLRFRRTSAWSVAAVAAILFVGHLPVAAGDTPALTIIDNASFSTNANTTFGWSFQLTNTTTTVTQLGFFDYNSDGLANAIPVAIWTSTGVQVASATVPAGTGGTLSAGFRYVPLTTAVALPAGTYTIGGLVTANSTDYFLANASTLTTAPGVIYGAPRGVAGNSLTYPSGDLYNGAYTNGYFGPDFLIGTVPEPRTLAVLALGVGGWLFTKRRARSGSKG